MKREIRYVKPCVILKGRWGRKAAQQIINAPRPDFTSLRIEVDKEKDRILGLYK